MMYDILLFIVAFMTVLSFYSEFISRTYHGRDVRLISYKGIMISLIGILLSVVLALTMCIIF